MRIHNLSILLAGPFGIAFGAILYYSLVYDDSKYTLILVPLAMLLMTIYIFHNQIDEWYIKRNPIPLDKQDQDIIKGKSRFYNQLNPNQQQVFETRIYQFIRSKEFIMMGKEQQPVPYDVQLIIAMVAIEISFYKEKYLYDNYDKIILYKHPFPTPQIQALHTVETHAEDGVILLALDHFYAAVNNPTRFYHVGYHAFAEAFIYEYKKENYPDILDWEVLERISGFTKEGMQQALGLKANDLLISAIYMYFVFNESMKKEDPELYKDLHSIFGTINIDMPDSGLN
jgi:hypothetical protein